MCIQHIEILGIVSGACITNAGRHPAEQHLQALADLRGCVTEATWGARDLFAAGVAAWHQQAERMAARRLAGLNILKCAPGCCSSECGAPPMPDSRHSMRANVSVLGALLQSLPCLQCSSGM